MKALRLYGKRDLRLEDIPIPVISEAELLVKIDTCTICGSDYRNVANGGSGHQMDLPRVMGHEIAATIVEVGEKWKMEFKTGDHLVVGGVNPCGKCPLCLHGYENQCLDKKAIACDYDGGFAAYMVVPERSIRSGNVLKAAAEDKRKLALSEPLSCAINGQEITGIRVGDTVMVVGCGPLGLFHIQLALLNGATKVIAMDLNPSRLKLAVKAGADVTISPDEVDVTKKIHEITGGLGVSAVIVAAPSSKAVVDALNWTGKRVRINIFGGMPPGSSEAVFDLNQIHYNEITITGTSDSTPRQLQLAAALIASGRIDTSYMISRVVGLAEAREIIVNGPEAEWIKIAVDPAGKE